MIEQLLLLLSNYYYSILARSPPLYLNSMWILSVDLGKEGARGRGMRGEEGGGQGRGRKEMYVKGGRGEGEREEAKQRGKKAGGIEITNHFSPQLQPQDIQCKYETDYSSE